MQERKRFKCSYNRIEIIISYLCNLRCNNCDAMVSQAPSNKSMTVDQIKKFISESTSRQILWKHIRLLGGEPTLHKDLFTIFDLLREYRDKYSPETKIQLVTNGYAPITKKLLQRIPPDIEIENSNKTSSFQPTFAPINIAPVDLPEYKNADFSKGCWIPSLCGITLDMHGYYPCSAAAAFDRVAGYNLGKKEFPAYGDLEKLFSCFCKLCGHFYDEVNNYAKDDIDSQEKVEQFEQIHQANFEDTKQKNYYSQTVYSSAWQKIMDKYKTKKPTLTDY